MNADRQSANRTALNPVSVEFHRLPCVSPVLVAPFLFRFLDRRAETQTGFYQGRQACSRAIYIRGKGGLASLADGAAIDDVCETDNRRFRLIGSGTPQSARAA